MYKVVLLVYNQDLKLCAFSFIPIVYALSLHKNLEQQKQINIRCQSLLSQSLKRLHFSH